MVIDTIKLIFVENMKEICNTYKINNLILTQDYIKGDILEDNYKMCVLLHIISCYVTVTLCKNKDYRLISKFYEETAKMIELENGIIESTYFSDLLDKTGIKKVKITRKRGVCIINSKGKVINLVLFLNLLGLSLFFDYEKLTTVDVKKIIELYNKSAKLFNSLCVG